MTAARARREPFRGLRPPGLAVAGAGLVLALAAGCGGGSAEQSADVVLLVFDALHAEHLSHLGYERETTPELDRLASEGFSFSRAFAPAPYTLASIPSLFTARLPDRHSLVTSDRVLPPEEVTLAELLGAAGYRTFAAVANIKGSSLYDLDQGFERFEELFDSGPEGATGVHIPRAEEFVPVFEGWMGALAPTEPAFLYAHVLEPHQPYDPPAEYERLWLDPAYTGRFQHGVTAELMMEAQGKVVTAERAARQEVGDDYVVLDRADVLAARALYDANLRYADHVLGRLLEILRRSNRYENAWILVTSDHGEALWQHGRWGHSQHLYDEMLRVPLVVKPPGRGGARGVVRDELVSNMDILPSLCEWLDLAPPSAELDGLSLAGLVAGKAPPSERSLFLRTFHREPAIGERTEGAKLILNRHPETGAVSRVQLFDLEGDADERQNLWDAAAADERDWREEVEARFLATRRDGVQRGAEYTEDQAELIEKLGYTD